MFSERSALSCLPSFPQCEIYLTQAHHLKLNCSTECNWFIFPFVIVVVTLFLC